ncbi:hypothetical protein HFP72_27035 [Nocardiopsis sp. ARC36]
MERLRPAVDPSGRLPRRAGVLTAVDAAVRRDPEDGVRPGTQSTSASGGAPSTAENPDPPSVERTSPPRVVATTVRPSSATPRENGSTPSSSASHVVPSSVARRAPSNPTTLSGVAARAWKSDRPALDSACQVDPPSRDSIRPTGSGMSTPGRGCPLAT